MKRSRFLRSSGVALVALGVTFSATLIGTSASFAAKTPPTVTSISPISGPGSGGTLVTITGTDLTGATKVHFVASGGSPVGQATDVVVVSSTEVQATSPTGSANDSPYDITVTTPEGTSATNAGDQFTYTADPTPGTISVKTSNFSIRRQDKLTITGKGWTPGVLIIITICNADASNTNPLLQLQNFDLTPDACEPVTVALSPMGSFAETTLSGPRAGDFTWTGSVIPGQLDPAVGSPLAECPQGQTQGSEGVNCIVGVAELIGFSPDGNTADAPVFFSPPKLSFSALYQGGLGTAAQYDVTLSDHGPFTTSGRPPVVSANGVPNRGGFGTDGLICQPGTGPGSDPPAPCSPMLDPPVQNAQGLWTVSPTMCQAASSPGGTAWTSALPLCTFDAAIGEPIEIELTRYTAPRGTGLSSPLPLGVPLDCSGGSSPSDLFTCSVSANAGPGVADPGGFDSSITDSGTGQSPPPALQNLPPGTYSFVAIGEVSGNRARTTLKLAVGPSS